MSLGSDYAPADDPENDVINELSRQGVLSVVAMGNNGDLTDTGGAPGNRLVLLPSKPWAAEDAPRRTRAFQVV